jgi:hypothetical protein
VVWLSVQADVGEHLLSQLEAARGGRTVTSSPHWLCLHLERGAPCNRRTMHAELAERFCVLHRSAPSPQPRPVSRAEYQRKRRAGRRNAGVPVAFEGVG